MSGHASVTTIEVSDFELGVDAWASDTEHPIVHVVLQRAACEFRLNLAGENEIDALEEQLRIARYAFSRPAPRDLVPACEVEVLR